MEIYPPKKIKIVPLQEKGRGVVATSFIAKYEIIEVSPIVVLGEEDACFVRERSDRLKHYYLHQTQLDRFCVMLGYASLCNHDFNPNATFEYDPDPAQHYVAIRALRDIHPGEEIVLNYNFDDDIVDF